MVLEGPGRPGPHWLHWSRPWAPGFIGCIGCIGCIGSGPGPHWLHWFGSWAPGRIGSGPDHWAEVVAWVRVLGSKPTRSLQLGKELNASFGHVPHIGLWHLRSQARQPKSLAQAQSQRLCLAQCLCLAQRPVPWSLSGLAASKSRPAASKSCPAAFTSGPAGAIWPAGARAPA